MTIDINNKEQVYNIEALASELGTLKAVVRDYIALVANKDDYAANIKHKEMADKYYRIDLGNYKYRVEVQLEATNIALHSMGLEKIEIKF